MQPRRPSARTSLWLAIAGLVLALGAAGVLATRVDPREARALRTPGAIVGVTYGQQPLLLGAPWQKWLLRAFPQLRERVGGSILESSTTPGTLVLWQNLGPVPENPLLIDDDLHAGIDVTLTGDHGEALHESLDAATVEVVGGSYLAAYSLKRYPRRGRRVRIQARDSSHGAGTTSLDCMLLNPSPGPHPVWQPVRLPARQTSGPLEVTFEGLAPGPARAFVKRPHTPGTYLNLRLREGGRPAVKGWTVEGVDIRDPTGNAWHCAASFFDCDEEQMSLHLGFKLPPEEPAYRVRVELARQDGFPADDVWTLRGLRVPRPRTMVRPRLRKRIHGCTLELTQLLGAGAHSDSGWSSTAPTAALRVTGPVARYCVRTVRPDSFWPWIETPYISGGAYCLNLRETTAGTTDLTLALTPRRTVEFLVHASATAPP